MMIGGYERQENDFYATPPGTDAGSDANTHSQVIIKTGLARILVVVADWYAAPNELPRPSEIP